MKVMRNACEILASSPAGNRPFEKHSHRKNDNMKMDISEI
jgi:hypothetical protein